MISQFMEPFNSTNDEKILHNCLKSIKQCERERISQKNCYYSFSYIGIRMYSIVFIQNFYQIKTIRTIFSAGEN